MAKDRIGEMAKVSLEKDKIKFLLVEGVHQGAGKPSCGELHQHWEYHKGALDAERLASSRAHFIDAIVLI